MALHRAFVDAAAKPLKDNLAALMKVFTNQSLPTAEKQALLPDLWSSLFLVVPLVSTTFASVNRMLGKLPPESLGWLLVDEAGQAEPQAAVGAIMRTKRAVIVGDPIQIEPIVMLPNMLTDAICRTFGVDSEQYSAPRASVQTLGDAASAYATEFEMKFGGSRTVGVPYLFTGDAQSRCSASRIGSRMPVKWCRRKLRTTQFYGRFLVLQDGLTSQVLVKINGVPRKVMKLFVCFGSWLKRRPLRIYT